MDGKMVLKGELKLPRPTGKYRVGVINVRDIEKAKKAGGMDAIRKIPGLLKGFQDWKSNVITDQSAVLGCLSTDNSGNISAIGIGNKSLHLVDNDDTPDATATVGQPGAGGLTASLTIWQEVIDDAPYKGTTRTSTWIGRSRLGGAGTAANVAYVMPSGASGAQAGKTVRSIQITNSGTFESAYLWSWVKLDTPVTLEAGDVFLVEAIFERPIIAYNTGGMPAFPLFAPVELTVTPRYYAYGEDSDNPMDGTDMTSVRWCLGILSQQGSGLAPATTGRLLAPGAVSALFRSNYSAPAWAGGNGSWSVSVSGVSGLSRTWTVTGGSAIRSVTNLPVPNYGCFFYSGVAPSNSAGVFPDALTNYSITLVGPSMYAFVHPEDVADAPIWGPGERFEMEISITITIEPAS